MKLTLTNAHSPFTGSLIDACNLAEGRERFRIQTVPLLGKILWDDSTLVEVERPFDGEKLFQQTGIAIDLHWHESTHSPKVLAKIHIGTKWTGPIAYLLIEEKKAYAAFSHGNCGKNYASGGTWSIVANLNQSYRPKTSQHIAEGHGKLTNKPTPSQGFPSLKEAIAYRFDPDNVILPTQTRSANQSIKLRQHIENILTQINLL